MNVLSVLRGLLGMVLALSIVAGYAWLLRRTQGKAARLPVLCMFWTATPAMLALLEHLGGAALPWLRVARPIGAVLPLALGAFTALRIRSVFGRMHAVRSFLASASLAAAITTLGFATAELELGHRANRIAAIVVVDRSQSTRRVHELDARIARELEILRNGMGPDDQVAVVEFGANVALRSPLSGRDAPLSVQTPTVDANATDIEAALRRALTEVPAASQGRIVLLSDGHETRGDALRASAAARTQAVPVDVLALDARRVPEARIVRTSSPVQVSAGESVDVRLQIETAGPGAVTVEVREDGTNNTRISELQSAGGRDTFILRQRALAPGLHRFTARIVSTTAQAGPADPTAHPWLLRVKGESTALVVAAAGTGEPVAAALREAGLLTQIITHAQLPTDAVGFAGYDLVVFGPAPATDVPEGTLPALLTYVRDLGGGLLLLGGKAAFGPGGYAKTPLEEVSPVSFDLKKDKRRASLAEVIAIDYSGSMSAEVSGQTKLALANEAAARSARLLSPADELGVAHVDTVVAWTIPLAPLGTASDVEARIRSVGSGGGGIYTDLALREGYQALRARHTNIKHLLLFADGDDAEALGGCRALVTAAEHDLITTSVISLGRGHDTPELEVLSRLGKGRFYLVDDARKLPSVFSQETILASRQALREETFNATTAAPSAALTGIDFAQAPTLGGYVVTVAKARSATHLTGLDGDPILSSWRLGLGRSALFASEFGAGWGSRWASWPGAPRMLAQLGRELARRSEEARTELTATSSGGRIRVTAQLSANGGSRTLRNLSAQLAGPNVQNTRVPLVADSRSQYSAELPHPGPGEYVVTLVDESSQTPVATAVVNADEADELQATGVDRALLSRIASESGGSERATLEGLFEDRSGARRSFEARPALWLWLAACAWVASVLARRLGMPEFLVLAADDLQQAVAAFARRRLVADASSRAREDATRELAQQVGAARRAQRQAQQAGREQLKFAEPAQPHQVPTAAAAPSPNAAAGKSVQSAPNILPQPVAAEQTPADAAPNAMLELAARKRRGKRDT